MLCWQKTELHLAWKWWRVLHPEWVSSLVLKSCWIATSQVLILFLVRCSKKQWWPNNWNSWKKIILKHFYLTSDLSWDQNSLGHRNGWFTVETGQSVGSCWLCWSFQRMLTGLVILFSFLLLTFNVVLHCWCWEATLSPQREKDWIFRIILYWCGKLHVPGQDMECP